MNEYLKSKCDAKHPKTHPFEYPLGVLRCKYRTFFWIKRYVSAFFLSFRQKMSNFSPTNQKIPFFCYALVMRQSHSPCVAVLIWKCVVIDLTGHKPPNEIATNHRMKSPQITEWNGHKPPKALQIKRVSPIWGHVRSMHIIDFVWGVRYNGQQNCPANRLAKIFE